MSTILDALKKVERERESPGDRLRHEPETTPPRSRRASTVTIVVCAVLGFGAGAGIALWRNAAPLPAETRVAVLVPPRIDVPGPRAGAGTDDAPAKPRKQLAREAAVPPRPAAHEDGDSALEPSPFEPPPAGDNVAVAAVPAPAAPPLADTMWPDSETIAALPPTVDAVPETHPDAERPVVPSIEDAAAADDAEDDTVAEDAVDLDDAPPPEPEETLIDTGRSPPGAPSITLSFLQWSADPARRFAFVSVDGGPSQRVREGDAAGAANVAKITPDGIQLRHAETLFVIRPRH